MKTAGINMTAYVLYPWKTRFKLTVSMADPSWLNLQNFSLFKSSYDRRESNGNKRRSFVSWNGPLYDLLKLISRYWVIAENKWCSAKNDDFDLFDATIYQNVTLIDINGLVKALSDLWKLCDGIERWFI